MINYAGKFGISREPREVETPSMSVSIGGKVGRRKNGKIGCIALAIVEVAMHALPRQRRPQFLQR